MKHKILILCNFHKEIVQELSSLPEIIFAKDFKQLEKVLCNEISTIVIRSGITIDKNFLRRFPNLSGIIRAGSGIDNIDIDLLEKRKVKLWRNKYISAPSVAEIAFLHLISLTRRIPESTYYFSQDIWAKPLLIGDDLTTLSVAIWGAGPVGKAVYKTLSDSVKSINFVSWESNSPDLPQQDREELIQTSDVHIICLPLNINNYHLFDSNFYQHTESKRPYVLNIGRYQLLNIGDSLSALKNGKIRGLSIDAIDKDHMIEINKINTPNLLPLNFMVTQHLGAQRKDVNIELGRWVIKTIKQEILPLEGKIMK